VYKTYPNSQAYEIIERRLPLNRFMLRWFTVRPPTSVPVSIGGKQAPTTNVATPQQHSDWQKC